MDVLSMTLQWGSVGEWFGGAATAAGLIAAALAVRQNAAATRAQTNALELQRETFRADRAERHETARRRAAASIQARVSSSRMQIDPTTLDATPIGPWTLHIAALQGGDGVHLDGAKVDEPSTPWIAQFEVLRPGDTTAIRSAFPSPPMRYRVHFTDAGDRRWTVNASGLVEPAEG